MKNLSQQFQKIKTLDMHTGGEPLRIVIEGYPEFFTSSILETRQKVMKYYDHIRKTIILEPRGHADMYGLIKVPPERPDSEFGVIFMHNEGYSTMCGHATIAIGRAAVDLGWVKVHQPLTTFNIDAPCGQIKVVVEKDNDEVTGVSFENVPSFTLGSFEVEIPKLGTLHYDLAYGGAFYAYCNAQQVGLDCQPSSYPELIKMAKIIKKKVIATNDKIRHPFESDLSFLYGVIFIEASKKPGIHSRNVCVFADGEVDRCATGSGVSGRTAILYSNNELNIGKSINIESIIGSQLSVKILRTEKYGLLDAVIPQVSGMAYYTGQHEFWIEKNDPLKNGFLLR